MIGAYRVASKLREVSDLKVCFIGSHSSALPKEVISEKFIDFVFINEGVYGLQTLLKTNLKNNLENCYDLYYKEAGEIKHSKFNKVVPSELMDQDLPGYAWDLLPKKKRVLDIYRAHYWHSFFKEKDRYFFAAPYTSLGCAFSCNFCMINIVNRNSFESNVSSQNFNKMRHWSPEFILDELEKLSKFGVKTLRLSDEMFFLNKKFYIPILEGIIERKLEFNIWTYARVDTVREDMLELFKKAGVNWLALGIEAANTEIRLEIDKGKFKQVNIRDVVKKIKSSGINVLGNYIFGFPNDNQKTMQQTLDLALELNTEHANFYSCSALPGSPLYFENLKNFPDDKREFSEYAFLSYNSKPMRTKHCSPEEVLAFRDQAWRKYFTNENYLNLVEKKFGIESRKNINELSKIDLKRKILEN